jgi:probable rRNA maturation factor
MQNSGQSINLKLNDLSIEMNINYEGWPDEQNLRDIVTIAVNSVSAAADLAYPDGARLSLLFTDNEHVQRLNSQFRDKDTPTNVLSFPYADIDPGQSANEMLGDIAFAFETISEEAALENKAFDNHLSHLVIHGFLHLFGYDHINNGEANIMEAHEISALATLGIENPYLEQ